MQVPMSVDYAARAMIELSQHFGTELTRGRDIADAHRRILFGVTLEELVRRQAQREARANYFI